jgi:predicted metal-dependent hydrolase
VIPTLPLPLRNRLAETILAALHDTRARAQLAALASDDGAAASWLAGADTRRELVGADTRYVGPLLERARRASAAVAGRPLRAPATDLATALHDAAALFDAGLHFEVHELLEPYWSTSEGATREALQGLIQAAVGFQHLANGNLAGARSLLTDATGRLHGRKLLGRDLDTFARGLVQAVEAVDRGAAVAVPAFPGRLSPDGRT